MFKKLFDIVFRQNLVIRQWGAIKQSAGQIGTYVTLINTIMIAVTLYSTGWIQENVVRIRFIPFMAVLFGLIALVLLVSWKLDVPSFFSSWNDQFWSHGNRMREYLEDRFDDLSGRIATMSADIEALKRGSDGDDSRAESNQPRDTADCHL